MHFIRFDVGDVLIGEDLACLVKACLQIGGGYGLLVTLLRQMDKPSPTTWILRPTDDWRVLLLPDSRFRQAACWYQQADGNFVVLQ